MRWWIVLALLLAFILVPFIVWGDQIESYAQTLVARNSGAIGAMAISGLLAADVFLPVPSSMVGTLAGAMFGTVIGAIVIWTGMTFGCLLAYGAGMTLGTPVLDMIVGKEARIRAGAFVDRRAILYLSLCRVVPVLAEASVLSASALNLGVARFMAITALANIPIAIVYAAIGSFAVGMNVFWPAFGAVGLTLLLYLAAVPALQRKKKVSET